MKIYLIRHGETQYNVDGRLQGWTNSVLTEKGRDDAREFGKSIKDEKFDAIFSSDLIRAKDTADIIIGENNYKAPHYIKEGLREWNFGSLEGEKRSLVPEAMELARKKGDVDKYFFDKYGKVISLYDEDGTGSNYEEVIERSIKALEEIGEEGKKNNWDKVFVVAHGMLMSTILFYLDNDLKLAEYRLPNLTFIELEYEDGLKIITDINKLIKEG